MNKMYDHFSDVSTSYNELRTTDPAPILFICEKLDHENPIQGADIGCGGGRYDLLLLQNLPQLDLVCGDINDAMIEETASYLKANGQGNFSVQPMDASDLRLPDNEMDFILTFNAIHHFDAALFLNQAREFLKESGYVFVYTRLKRQNGRNIWGRFFPNFAGKEDRLYDLHQIEGWADEVESISLEEIRFFRFKRIDSLTNLLRQAENKHYSTFGLYTGEEFDEALNGFRQRIEGHFADSGRIEWVDENVMVVFRKNG